MLRELTIVVRAQRWRATAEGLERAGFTAFTRQRVSGRGRQRGLRYAAGGEGIRALPKWLFTLVLEDERVDAAVAAVLGANRSGVIGDGKIFVAKVDDVTRLSDGAAGRVALAGPAGRS